MDLESFVHLFWFVSEVFTEDWDDDAPVVSILIVGTLLLVFGKDELDESFKTR